LRRGEQAEKGGENNVLWNENTCEASCLQVIAGKKGELARIFLECGRGNKYREGQNSPTGQKKKNAGPNVLFGKRGKKAVTKGNDKRGGTGKPDF